MSRDGMLEGRVLAGRISELLLDSQLQRTDRALVLFGLALALHDAERVCSRDRAAAAPVQALSEEEWVEVCRDAYRKARSWGRDGAS